MEHPLTLPEVEPLSAAIRDYQKQYGHSFNLLSVRHGADVEADRTLLMLLDEFQRYYRGAAQLILAGVVPSADLVSLADQQGIGQSIVHIPMAQDQESTALLAVADIYLAMGSAPSLSRIEEAFAAAVPVLAQRSDITAGCLSERGLLFDPGEPAEMAVAAALLAHEPQFFRALKQECGSRPVHDTWVVDGPFDSSYSLAIVNRELARGLFRQGCNVGLWSSEEAENGGPNEAFLSPYPDVLSFYRQGGRAPEPRVLLRNNYPPLVDDMRAAINVLANYAWEESAYPEEYVRSFNRRLNLITVCSPLVKKILRDAGVRTPLVSVGNGVDHLEAVTPQAPVHGLGKGFRFLHVSSCFPRKGLDVLLAAYGEAFRRTDDVTLVIKTFPNPHNDAAAQIDRHQSQDPDYPAVVLIDEDISDAGVAGIYRACDAFVLPSRAEGFGLPAAEAMLADLPVIVTGFGGQRSFCDDATAWLVDYRFSRAQTHLGLFDSAWVEPDLADLARQMRVVHGLSADAIQVKTRAARKRLLSSLRWEQVAQRTAQAVAALDALPILPAEPNIGWFSTWNSRCGIATYSEHLLTSVPPRRTTLLANSDAELLRSEGDNVRRCWVAGSSDLSGIKSVIEDRECQVVVIQYHYAFLPLAALAELIHWLRSRSIPVYLALHNTAPPRSDLSLADITPALRMCNRLLVHSIDDLNRLKGYGLIENVTLFPHGVYPSPARVDSQSIRNQLKIGDRQVLASFGFLMPHKGVKQLIRAFSFLAEEHREIHLLLVNALYPAQLSEDEREACLALISEFGLESRITLVTDFLSDQETLALLSIAECIVFPYQHTEESASGAVRMGIATRCPVLVTPLKIFGDVIDAVDLLPGTEPEELAAGLRAFLASLSDPEALAEQRQRAERWRQAHQWPLLSERLLGLIDGEYGERFLQSVSEE